MSKPKPAPLPPGTVVGGYQVIKKLAAGGFGVVYLAEDPDKHLVALKEYLPASLAERSPGELIPRVKHIELAGDPVFTPATFVSGLKRLPIRYELT